MGYRNMKKIFLRMGWSIIVIMMLITTLSVMLQEPRIITPSTVTSTDIATIGKTAKLLDEFTTVKIEVDKPLNILYIYRTVDFDGFAGDMVAKQWCKDFKQYNFDTVVIYKFTTEGLKSIEPRVFPVVGRARC